ncbi:CheY-like chemotaxis protein [Desulfomicrobium macestii]|uniref:CheY-like chemotaxis protein n=1 Tax=Desulfomicrobium macestii TaxID=90731 RepID=A0ABR9H215_9BACT|nr:response regulator [Desulfomicrobium macestii]MBE1424756.1 CheY-like chemotaxis protein [Desulfomicrobium macestii]
MIESKLCSPQKSVLVVDDDEICRCVTSEVLENLGLKVDLAENADQATSLAKANSYDLILLDFHMPVMNGIDLARHLQDNGAATEDRIYLLTGEEPEAILKKMHAGSSLRIFHKPLELAQVMSYFSPRENEDPIGAATYHPLKITGFDMSHALANFLGNESAFFNVLREFPAYGAKFIFEYSTHLKNRNIKECMRLAHSLKGSSLMIGATEINMLAKALESACHGASDMQRVGEIFEKMEAKILEASESIKKHLQDHSA